MTDLVSVFQMFQFASGSMTGRDHRMVPKNNQDATHTQRSKDVCVAVVADGCSSGAHSEFGAVIGARLVAVAAHDAIYRALQKYPDPDLTSPLLWARVQTDVLAYMRTMAYALNPKGSLTEFVSEYFLFTVLGVAVTPTQTVFFGVGDGVFAVNGKITVLLPAEGNKPAYLGYNLLDTVQTDFTSPEIAIRAWEVVLTADVESFMIATDGASVLLETEEMMVPGTMTGVGDIDQFWKTDRFFTHPNAVTQRLLVLGRDAQRVDYKAQLITKSPGIFSDDVTMVTGRRVPGNKT